MVRKFIPPKDSTDSNDSPFSIRPGTAEDLDFIKGLSTKAFKQYGDYGTFLPSYLTHPSVFTALGELQNTPIGFAMLALVASDQLMPWQKGTIKIDPHAPPEEWLDAELVAIAVVPEYQAHAYGTRLMKYIIQFAEAWHHSAGVRSVQLNVAESNHRAINLFVRMGFKIVNDWDGNYPKGQRSIRMARPLQ